MVSSWKQIVLWYHMWLANCEDNFIIGYANEVWSKVLNGATCSWRSRNCYSMLLTQRGINSLGTACEALMEFVVEERLHSVELVPTLSLADGVISECFASLVISWNNWAVMNPAITSILNWATQKLVKVRAVTLPWNSSHTLCSK